MNVKELISEFEQPPECSRYILSSDGDFVCDCGIVIERQLPLEAPETKQAYRNGFEDGFEIGKAQCETHHEDMKAEAAAQAREKVLEQLSDLNRYACQEYDEASCLDNEREMRIHLEYGNRTWGIIRLLRNGGDE